MHDETKGVFEDQHGGEVRDDHVRCWSWQGVDVARCQRPLECTSGFADVSCTFEEVPRESLPDDEKRVARAGGQ